MSNVKLQYLPIDQLVPTPDNPRAIREDQAFIELVESVKSVGILQPLIARPLPDSASPDMYDLRAGHRRLLAASKAGLKTVPVIVREMDDKTAMEITVTENLQRENLHPIEESLGIQRLLDVGWDVQAIADRLGKSPAWVARRARLRSLSPKWREAIANPQNKVSLWPANLLDCIARLPAEAQNIALEEMPSFGGYNNSPVPSVQELNRFLQAEILHTLGGAPFKLDDDTLLPWAGACSVCVKRASCQPLLFEEIELAKKGRKGGGDRCLDLMCYKKKVETFNIRKIEELKAEYGKVAVLTDCWLSAHDETKIKKRYGAAPIVDCQVAKVRANEKGAIPAVVVNSDNTGRVGQVVWINPPNVTSSSDRDRQKREKGTPTPLRDRRKALMKRRMAHVITAVLKILENFGRLLQHEAEDGDGACGELNQRGPSLVLAFGTAHRRDRHGNCLREIGPKSLALDPWKALAKYSNQSAVDLGRELVLSVIPVISDRLVYFNGDDAARKYPEAREVCKLFGFNLPKLERDAEVAIPEPKSWANLRADVPPRKSSKKNKETMK